jgi:hypothetical protein
MIGGSLAARALSRQECRDPISERFVVVALVPLLTQLARHRPATTGHFLLPLPDISVGLSAIMICHSFLSRSALSAVPVVARAAEDAPEPVWQETVTSDVMKFRCSDAEDRVVFEVELFQPAESDIKEATDATGGFLHYLYKGQPQPYPFRPGVNLIRRFDLTWEGKAMKIPERFQDTRFSRFPVSKRPHRRSLPLP